MLQMLNYQQGKPKTKLLHYNSNTSRQEEQRFYHTSYGHHKLIQ